MLGFGTNILKKTTGKGIVFISCFHEDISITCCLGSSFCAPILACYYKNSHNCEKYTTLNVTLIYADNHHATSIMLVSLDIIINVVFVVVFILNQLNKRIKPGQLYFC